MSAQGKVCMCVIRTGPPGGNNGTDPGDVSMLDEQHASIEKGALY